MHEGLANLIHQLSRGPGTTEKSIELVLGSILNSPQSASRMTQALKELLALEDNSAEFQELAKAVWAKLPVAILAAEATYAAMFEDALTIANA